MLIEIVIECAAGATVRQRLDEQTLELRVVREVSTPYPYAYGFVPGTAGPDGDCLDCYVLAGRPLQPGERVRGVLQGLMEQFEGPDEEIDHKLLAALEGEPGAWDAATRQSLEAFIYRLFSKPAGYPVRVGRFLDQDGAQAYFNLYKEQSAGEPD